MPDLFLLTGFGGFTGAYLDYPNVFVLRLTEDQIRAMLGRMDLVRLLERDFGVPRIVEFAGDGVFWYVDEVDLLEDEAAMSNALSAFNVAEGSGAVAIDEAVFRDLEGCATPQRMEGVRWEYSEDSLFITATPKHAEHVMQGESGNIDREVLQEALERIKR